MDTDSKKILVRLEAQCAKREYCSHDIFQKALARLDGDTDRAQEILSSLVSEGYVDDLRYAAAFAREKSAITGWGPVKIRYALAAKHIPKETIDEALTEIDGARAEDRLRKTLEGKWKSLEGGHDAKLKLLKFALTRGYGYEQIRNIVDEITSR